jgi:hypothetical protein
MLIGLIAGLLAPDWRGLFFICLAAPAVRFGFFIAGGGQGLWNDYAAMFIVSYATALVVAALTFGIKRNVRPRA